MKVVSVDARVARIVDSLHPFQHGLNATVADPNNRVICVEAAVGAGKSHIVHIVLEWGSDAMSVLTYPTKILMDSQLAATAIATG